jgi:uncharacterized membrane protein
MKTLAFIMALVIMAFGAVVIFVPSWLEWITRQAVTSSALYVIAAVRVAFGLVLISVASVSRAPKTIRVLGYLILIAGVATAVMGLVAIERFRGIVEWWLQQGTGVFRLAGVVVLGLGGFIAYACAPARRAA